MPRRRAITLDTFFGERSTARRIFTAVERAISAAGACTVRVTKSQIAFSRQRGFAWVWTPDRWRSGKTAPLVLSLALSRKDRTGRWKEIVEPSPGRFMHHLELESVRDVDQDVRTWIAEAWAEAGPTPVS